MTSLGLAACTADTRGIANGTGAGGAGGDGSTVSAGGGSPGGSGGMEQVTPSLTRLGDTFEIPTIAAASPKRFVDVAYDPDQDGYLVVHGSAAIGGAFLDAEGAPRGAPFQIAETTAWTQAPRTAYGGAADGFLVAWHDTREDGSLARLRGRLVKYDGAQASFSGADFAIASEPTHGEMPPGMAYSPTSQVFLVVWQRLDQSDLRARRVTPAGQLVGEEIVLSSDPDWQSDAAVAWHPQRDEFCVVYSHAGAVTSILARCLAAGTGEVLGTPKTLTRASGTWLPQITWLPSTGGYLVGWYAGKLEARRLTADLADDGASFALFAGLGSYDGFALSAVSPEAGTIAAVMHGTTDEDWAGALVPSGDQSAPFEATSSPGDEGNFNPRIAASTTRAEWLTVSARGFATIVGQRLGR